MVYVSPCHAYFYHPNTVKRYLSSTLFSRQFTKTAYFSIESTVIYSSPHSLTHSVSLPSNFRFSYCSV